MKELPNIFIIEDAVTPTSIVLQWNISGDPPKTVKVSRMSPTVKLLAHLTPEQFAATNTLSDTDLTPATLYSYTISCEYDDSIELSYSVEGNTAALSPNEVAVANLTINTNYPPQTACRKDGNVNVTIQWDNDSHAAWVRVARDASPPPYLVDEAVPSIHMSQYDIVSANSPHNYAVTNWLGPGPHGNNTTSPIGPVKRQCAHTLFTEADSGFLTRGFELLVPQGDVVSHYEDISVTIQRGIWHKVDVLNIPEDTQVQDTAVLLVPNRSLMQERFDAIVWITSTQGDDYLIGYEFDSASGEQEPFTIVTDTGPIDGVTGSPAFIATGPHTFALLVPRQGSISSYEKTGGTITGTWTFVEMLQPDGDSQATAVSFVLDVGPTGTPPTAVVRMTPTLGSDYLVIYQETASSGWQGPFALVTNDGPIDRVSGSPTLTESDGPPIQYELLVPRDGVVYYYTHPVATLEGPWIFVDTLKPPNDDPEIQATAVSLTLGISENLETVVRVSPPDDSDYLVGYEFNRISGWDGPFDLVSDDGPILASDGQSGYQTPPDIIS